MRRIIISLAAIAMLALAAPSQAQDVAAKRKANIAAKAAKADKPAARSPAASAAMKRFEAWKASVKARKPGTQAPDLQQSAAPGRGAAAAKIARKVAALKAKPRAAGAAQAVPSRAKAQGAPRSAVRSPGAAPQQAKPRAAAPASAPR